MAGDTSGAMARYNTAIAHGQDFVHFMKEANKTHDEMIAYLKRVQPEPDYSVALKAADYEAMFDRLGKTGLVQGDKEQWSKVVNNVRQKGAYGLITANSESLDAAVKQAQEFLKAIKDSAPVVADKHLLRSLESGEVPIFQKTNQTLVALNQADADCTEAALIAKEVRGTAGWMSKGAVRP